MRISTKATAVALALATLALGACGDDSGSKSSGTTATTAAGGSATTAAGGSTTAAAPTGDPIKIGVPARLSGQGSISYAGLPQAASSWEKWVNAQGGINGHPVQVVVGDSASDPAKGLALVKKMVETDKVLAIHPEDPTLDNAMAPYATSAGVPVASSYAAYPLWMATPGWFALGILSTVDGTNASLDIMKKAGKTSVSAVVCAEVAACGAAGDALSKQAPGAGIRYDGTTKVAATAPNYTAECLALKNKNTEVLYMGVSIDVAKKLYADCTTQGYKPFLFFPYHSINNRLTELPGVSALGMLPTIPWYADVPATKDFREAITKYGDISKIDEPSMFLWTSLEFMRMGMEAGKITPTSSFADVAKALAAVKTNENGAIADVSFTEGQPSPHIKCYFVDGFSDGKFTLPEGDKAQCLSS